MNNFYRAWAGKNVVLLLFLCCQCSSLRPSHPPTQLDSPLTVAPNSYRLKPGDHLSIRNLSVVDGFLGVDEKSVLPEEFVTTVTSDGTITLPGIGRYQVAGCSRRELSDSLSAWYSPLLLHPVFDIQVTNLKVKVLGSTGIQGVIPIEEEVTSLGEVLARSAGIRFMEAGQTIHILRGRSHERQIIAFTYADLHDPQVLEHPIFADDLLYIPPSKKAIKSAATQKNYYIIQPILTAFNLTVIALNVIRYLR